MSRRSRRAAAPSGTRPPRWPGAPGDPPSAPLALPGPRAFPEEARAPSRGLVHSGSPDLTAQGEGTNRLHPGLTLTDISTWADEVRPSRPNTAPWHYVNIPGGASGYNAQRDCPRGCVVSAIEQSLRLLQDLSKGWAIRQRHAWTSPIRGEAIGPRSPMPFHGPRWGPAALDLRWCSHLPRLRIRGGSISGNSASPPGLKPRGRRAGYAVPCQEP